MRRAPACAPVTSVIFMIIATVVSCLTSACSRQPSPGTAQTTTSAVALETWTTTLADKLSSDGPYQKPSDDQRTAAASALNLLLINQSQVPKAIDGFAALGFVTTSGSDAATGRPYVVFANGPDQGAGWGVVVVDLSRPTRLAIEIPHPRSDINTENLGLDLFRAVPGSVLLMAGAHRRAAGDTADVAHSDTSMFHALATQLATRGIAQLQLHGFADQNLPDTQIVVSTGTAPASLLAQRIATALSDRGFETCRAWRKRCGQLEGTTNVQGLGAQAAESPFIHVEISYSIRRDPKAVARVIESLASSVG